MKIFTPELLLKIYGERILEAYFLDAYLRSFSDGLPRDLSKLEPQDEILYIHKRVNELLLSKEFIKPFGELYIITSLGIMHLNKGGYTGEFATEKLKRLSFFLSLIAIAISIIAAIRPFL
ncbi:MAG: hypothetical protein ACRC9X_06325 [Bacteroidales bacterium]